MVQLLLSHHGEAHFPFLAATKDPRQRTTFYEALGRVVGSDVSDDNTALFECFLAPFDVPLAALNGALTAATGAGAAGGLAPHDLEQARRLLVGLARDLRGLTASITSRPGYAMLFDWMYPTLFQVFLKGVQLWADDPAVTTSVLKCLVRRAWGAGRSCCVVLHPQTATHGRTAGLHRSN